MGLHNIAPEIITHPIIANLTSAQKRLIVFYHKTFGYRYRLIKDRIEYLPVGGTVWSGSGANRNTPSNRDYEVDPSEFNPKMVEIVWD